MSAAAPFTILVNSCDGFSDCWPPFFTLMQAHWPEAAARPILLNTETVEAPSLPLAPRSTCVARGAPRRLTWSEATLRALDRVHTPLLLYLQDDYFLTQRVRQDLVESFAQTMLADPGIAHLGLTHLGSHGPFTPTADACLWRIGPRARYRISLQAGFWRPAALRLYLYAPENAWMLEQFGTLRAWRRDDLFLTVNRDLYGAPKQRVMDYLGTGIMKGQWHPGVPALFAQHGLALDYARRGLYREGSRLKSRAETLAMLTRQPLATLRSAAKTLFAP